MPSSPADPSPDPARVTTRVATPARSRPKNPAARRALGDVIRALRTKRGWSQERLALECGYDRAYVGQLERGQRWPTVEAVWYVLHALGADWTEFGDAMQGEPTLRAAPAARSGRPDAGRAAR